MKLKGFGPPGGAGPKFYYVDLPLTRIKEKMRPFALIFLYTKYHQEISSVSANACGISNQFRLESYSEQLTWIFNKSFF